MGQKTCQILGQVSLNLFYWKKNLQTEKCGPGERLTRKQLTSMPDHLWPELWEKMGKNAKLKEKQKWSHEKLHLDNARKLHGIYFIDPEDKEFNETIKNARKKWPKSWSSIEDPVVPLERNLYGHPLAGLLWEREFEKILLKYGLGESFQLGMLIRTP